LPDERVPEEGWRIMELDDLYNELECVIMLMLYERRVMKSVISKLSYYFKSRRMIHGYAPEAYL
jgi:hypothetical protein